MKDLVSANSMDSPDANKEQGRGAIKGSESQAEKMSLKPLPTGSCKNGKRLLLLPTVSVVAVLACLAAQVLLIQSIESSHGSVSAKSCGTTSKSAPVESEINLRDWLARYDEIVSTVALTEAEHQKLSAALVAASVAPLTGLNREETAYLLRSISGRYRAGRTLARALPGHPHVQTTKFDLCAYIDSAISLVDDTYASLDSISKSDTHGNRPVLAALLKRMGQLESLSRKHSMAAYHLRMQIARADEGGNSH